MKGDSRKGEQGVDTGHWTGWYNEDRETRRNYKKEKSDTREAINCKAVWQERGKEMSKRVGMEKE